MNFTGIYFRNNLNNETTFATTATLDNNYTTSADDQNLSFSQHIYNLWMLALIWCSILLAAGIYIVISLSIYEWRVSSKNKKIGKHSAIIKDKNTEWTRWLCLACSVFYLPRMIIEFAELFEGQRSGTLCDVAYYAKTISLAGTVTCVYLVLWLRQRKVYNSPTFKHLSSKPVKFLSSSIIILIATALVTTVSLHLSTRTYAPSIVGCVLVDSTIPGIVPGLLYAILTTSFQVILVGLFIYPLYKHRTTKFLSGEKSLRELVKRLLATTLVVVLTTVIGGIFVVTIFSKDYNQIADLFVETDSLVNLLAIIFSFKDWKARIFSFHVEEAEVMASVRKKTTQVDSQTASRMLFSNVREN